MSQTPNGRVRGHFFLIGLDRRALSEGDAAAIATPVPALMASEDTAEARAPCKTPPGSTSAARPA
ncbi:hypothetical protein [Zestomonas thermotolerans]|uniref:hypothetical protein n=1 Tax=Zestomonas thermotolerans TaxID=157784 RepID=UPI00036E2485|nr:hypothetical protein [Pseudomonas thermotolerans]